MIEDRFVVLAIESSCDETAVALVSSDKKVLSHKMRSQSEHKNYGGVIPEISSRAHVEFLQPLIVDAISESKLNFSDIDVIAATAGPGLIGGLIVGIMTAKSIAHVLNKPFIAINHLEAHALVVRMFYQIDFPFLLLIISGGHCQFLIVRDVNHYKKIGESLDDSLGESFDKVARMLGFDYPGGYLIERHALQGDMNRFLFPRAMVGRSGCNFSFSGLKTAVKNVISKIDNMDYQDKCDIAASFQKCVSDILIDRLFNATKIAKDFCINKLVVTGGVSANEFLRAQIEDFAYRESFNVFFPPIELCTDNGVMIGWAGVENFLKGYTHSLNFEPKARWPLEEMNGY